MATPEEHELADHKGKSREDSYEGFERLDEPPNKHASYYLAIKQHRGLPRLVELILFYNLAMIGWLCLIAAAVLGSYKHTRHKAFISTITAAYVFHWAAWCQTAFAMLQRASYRREETLAERVQFLFFSIRLQRLMIPTAIISLVTFIEAYARRYDTDDLAYWLVFLLMFIVNTVFSVMNAYNNITWEADRLWYDDRLDGIPKVVVAILGI